MIAEGWRLSGGDKSGRCATLSSFQIMNFFFMECTRSGIVDVFGVCQDAAFTDVCVCAPIIRSGILHPKQFQ